MTIPELAADQWRSDTGPSDQPGPAGPDRRAVLGALALGLVAAACRDPEEGASTLAPGLDGSAPAGDGASSVPRPEVLANPDLPPTATGPELERVSLPVPTTAGDPSGGSDDTGSVSGDGSSDGAMSGGGGEGAGESTSTVAGASDPVSVPSRSQDTVDVPALPRPDETSAASPPSPPAADSTPPPPSPPAADPTPPSPSEPSPPAADPTPPSPSESAPPAADPTPPSPSEPAPPADPVTTPRQGSAPKALVANRITFGPTPAVWAELDRLGPGGFTDDQLARPSADPAVEARLGSYRILHHGPSLAAFNVAKELRRAGVSRELTQANLLRAVHSRHQLYEMMCQLWMDHFNVDLLDEHGHRHLLAHHQEQVIRPHAMGSFRDLLKATAQSPAMLVYLNNDTSNANDAQGLNENYGRELLELHTLGISPSGAQVYTEADVRAAAMAMSGWSVVTDRRVSDYSSFTFRPGYHHQGPISLLGGAWTRGTTTGRATGQSLLEFLVVHPATARHIAWKLCRRFVSDQPPESLVASTAATYLAHDTELVPTLRHVLASAEFAASGGAKLRRSFEYVAAVARALGTGLSNDPTGELAREFQETLERLGQVPWGWPQPDGFPDEAGYWLSTDGLSARWGFGARMATNTYAGKTADLAALFPSGPTVDQTIDALAARLALGQLTAQEKDAITTAARVAVDDPAAGLDDRARGTIAALMLAHPVFQTR